MKTVARLFEQFKPSHYDVSFAIDEDAMRFYGRVIVQGKKAGRPSQRLTLHQKGLKITNAAVIKHDKKGDQPLAVTRINPHESFNEVRLHTEQMAYPGDYTITVDFEAPVTDGMVGIYPCYFKHDGQAKKLFATQFESHHAREAFPCIDEPEAKATFDLHLITQPGITALGNTPIKTQVAVTSELVDWLAGSFKSKLMNPPVDQPTSGPAYQLTNFQTTPKMSTYLLAFVYGELHSRSSKTERGTEVNAWATVAQPIESLDYAADIGKRTIEFFEDYFGIDYPLPKADHVALPDFSAGAMENWGLITYRERTMLLYPEDTSQSTREYVSTVIAHETSHQWFGNLVTMRWWNDLWLNESFANMMEYQAVDSLFPDWHIWDSFVGMEGLSAFRRDSVYGVQSVRTAVNHPDEINTLFDGSIVYAKGGRLLYMLKNYIGEDAFRSGLKRYFEIHAYGNTEGSDLWAALSEASGKDVAGFMDPWLNRSGFPLVTVTQNEDEATITQQHFQEDRAKADPQRVWPVPLFTDAAGQPDMFETAEIKLHLPDDSTALLNTRGRGHYLVRYDGEQAQADIKRQIADKSLSDVDRLMILNAASMTARAGYIPYREVLDLLASYTNEDSEPVWDIISLVVGESRRFIDSDESLEAGIKQFVSKLVAAQVKRLGWEQHENETSADQKLRGLVLGLSAYAEDEATVQRATEAFKKYQAGDRSLPTELRALTFIVPIKNGNKAAFDYLLNLHDSTNNGELQGDACAALTATRDPEQAKLLLERIKDSKIIKPQDADRWVVYLMRSRYTRDIAWDWLVANWDWFETTFAHDKSYDYMPRYAASIVNNRDYQKKYDALFDDKIDQLVLERNIKMGKEEIATRLAWLERDLSGVQAFFKK